MTRVGAIDLGTNSTRLLIAEVEGERVEDLARRSAVTRLGEGVDAGRVLLPEPVARVRAVLAEYRRELETLRAERTLAVATSAVRDATNGRSFLAAIEASFGFDTRILSGEEEAQLTRRGVGAVDPGTLILDVGGGSTELMLADFRISLDVGSVRLTERFLHGDPPAAAELAEAAGFVRGLLPALRATSAIGVAGTVTQLRELVGDLTLDVVERELGRLASMPVSERARLPHMDPDRAPVILGGAIIVVEILRHYRLTELLWSARDLLDGVALEVAAMGESSGARAPS
jgi:exopolyphosphatase/guanosine-5'-triphosphate,3'-diphosphate pyrophosphatase